jgi:hypothetical protein
VIEITGCDIVKVGIDIIVPGTFRTAAKSFGIHTIGTILVCLPLGQTTAYVFHLRAVEDFDYTMLIQVAQHVRIASTTGFDITTWIDMQPTPWGCTIEIGHVVFTSGPLGQILIV